jgi:hypothetical protein
VAGFDVLAAPERVRRAIGVVGQRGSFAEEATGRENLVLGLALLARQRETLIVAVTFLTLPVTFLSSAFIQQSLVPGWIRWAARFNRVNWAIQAGRSAATQQTD